MEMFAQRARELVAQMTLEEKVSQMRYDAPAIERLGIPAYNWWNECLHGVGRSGTATVFPQPIGMAASFDESLMEHVAQAISDEARAKYNQYKTFGETGIYQGLTFWSPKNNQFIHPDVLPTCQLSMGMTVLEPGSVWNTMPAHTHERRMEVYMYFEVPEDNVVFHMMGEGRETRHIVMQNEQAVISPSWSIHAGAGTSNYTFIWAMGGENQAFDDMDVIPTTELR